MEHEHYMRLALELAEQGRGRTSPNPLVGAVIVKDCCVVGKGYHPQAGLPHAEVYALEAAGEKAKDSTLYVTLEPCCHYGRTPPCTAQIIQSGVKQVVIAALDPNPKMQGKSVQILEEAGIKVTVGILQADARLQNEVFRHHLKTGLPFVTLKWAMTLDGKIATYTGDSKWITGEQARLYAHRLRDINDAILVGTGTVQKDDPRLTTRLAQEGKDPIRVILDPFCETSPLAKVVKTESKSPTIIFCNQNADQSKQDELRSAGVTIVALKNQGEHLDLNCVLQELAKRNITSILVEGGGEVHSSFVADNFVNRVVAFVSPKIIGGRQAISPVEGQGVANVSQAMSLCVDSFKQLGNDLILSCYLE